MEKYSYFPSQYDGHIRSLLLDANITAHLDSIARKGSSFVGKDVRPRMADLVKRLHDDVVVMPGLGAAESVLRRGEELPNFFNYYRRSRNAKRLLVDDRDMLLAWLNGDEVQPDSSTSGEGEYLEEDRDSDFKIVRQDMIVPSYAMLLTAYKLYLDKGKEVSHIRELQSFAEEIYGRGSREFMLGCLLLAGNSNGRSMALNIMKLHDEKNLKDTLNALWNTSFDLTYSRIATQPLLPEFKELMPQPAVFVTDDRHLGTLLKIIQPVGAATSKGGGDMTADLIPMESLIREDFLTDVTAIVNSSSQKSLQDTTDVQLVQKIRRYKSRIYVEQLENWFAHRYTE